MVVQARARIRVWVARERGHQYSSQTCGRAGKIPGIHSMIMAGICVISAYVSPVVPFRIYHEHLILVPSKDFCRNRNRFYVISCTCCCPWTLGADWPWQLARWYLWFCRLWFKYVLSWEYHNTSYGKRLCWWLAGIILLPFSCMGHYWGLQLVIKFVELALALGAFLWTFFSKTTKGISRDEEQWITY